MVLYVENGLHLIYTHSSRNYTSIHIFFDEFGIKTFFISSVRLCWFWGKPDIINAFIPKHFLQFDLKRRNDNLNCLNIMQQIGKNVIWNLLLAIVYSTVFLVWFVTFFLSHLSFIALLFMIFDGIAYYYSIYWKNLWLHDQVNRILL